MQTAKYRLANSTLLLLSACIVGMLMLATPAVAHEGHVHKFMGAISAVHDGQLTVKTTDGKQVTFAVNDKTEIVRGGAKASTSDLTEGTRVVVEAAGGKEPMAARRIRLGTASK